MSKVVNNIKIQIETVWLRINQVQTNYINKMEIQFVQKGNAIRSNVILW